MFDKKAVSALAEKYDSFYLYDESVILQNAERLQRDCPGALFLYSVKCNSAGEIISRLIEKGFGLDAASLEECKMGAREGLAPGMIYYSAPGKSEKDIEEALDLAVLIADSVGEVERIQRAAEKKGRVVEIGLRINPAFSISGDEGESSKFGIDEELAYAFAEQWKRFKNLKITGIHVHLKSQELDAAVLGQYYERMFALAEYMERLFGPLSYLNLGSGVGIPVREEDVAFDTAALGKSLSTLMVQYRSKFPQMKVMIETGRYVVGTAGVYVTKVLDKKISRGKTYILAANTLNGYLKPSIAALLKKYTEEKLLGFEPLFSGSDSIRMVSAAEERKELETVTIAGNLCTAADVVFSDITLPRLEVGDVLVFLNAGSYAAVLSPMQFASQRAPKEFFLTKDGSLVAANPEKGKDYSET